MLNQGILSGKITATGILVGIISKSTVYQNGGVIYEEYEGTYEVTPKMVEQTLSTQRTLVADDIKIKPIPYSESENSAGGITVIIG